MGGQSKEGVMVGWVMARGVTVCMCKYAHVPAKPAYLGPLRLSRVGRVQLPEDPFALGLLCLLLVDVIHLGLPAPEDQHHGAGAQSWTSSGRSAGTQV